MTSLRYLTACVIPLCAMLAFSVEAAERIHVDASTEVRRLRFEGVRSLRESELRSVVQTQGRGTAFGLRTVLGTLPFVSRPTRHVFHPRVLQEDVVRLRRKYLAAGFMGTQISYDVRQVKSGPLIDVTFVVDEGAPQILAGLQIIAADSLTALPVSEDEKRDWSKLEARAQRLVGGRIDAATVIDQRNDIEAWWWDRGHPHAIARTSAERDSLRNELRLTFRVDPGAHSTIGSITLEGNQTVADDVILRELPFTSGDAYSESALLEGRRGIQQLPIVRTARVEAPTSRDTARAVAGTDSVIPISVTLAEAKPRLISGQLGYVTDGGMSSEVSWSHRNFGGGARIFTASALAQTGWLALAKDPDLRYRTSLSLQQPHFMHRRLSGVVSPFMEYREDLQARALEAGSNFTLIYRLRDRISGSIDYRIAWRRIFEYRLGDLAAGDSDFLSVLSDIVQGQLDSLGSYSRSSLLTLSATASWLDQITNPRRGLLVRPTVQVTAPSTWSSLNYWRTDVSAFGFLPLVEHTTLATRVNAGRLFPFGRNIPDNEGEVLISTLQLREVNFTAGGSADVRGWNYRMLGPKFPDIRFVQQGDSLVLSADGYVPEGGMSRVTFSVELRLPFPLLGPNFGSHVFLDGGRVWTQDQRFNPGDDPLGVYRFFYGTGAGMDLFTPIGAIKFGLGYKLNPSVLDLADSGDIIKANENGTPIEDIPQRQSRRWAIYFALGSSF